MVKFSVIVTGDEILNCTVRDENYFFICNELNSLGYLADEILFLRDSREKISYHLKRLVKDNDIIILTGGLGPAPDDNTLSIISEAFSIPLELNTQALVMIKEAYGQKRINRWREKMAYIPSGAIPIKNDIGTAPGILLNLNKTWIIALPGVPSEMRYMFENYVKNEIIKKFGKINYIERNFILENTDESSISDIIENLRKNFPGIYIKTRAGAMSERGKIILTISFRGDENNFLEILEKIKIEFQEKNVNLKIP
ncbi:MAG: molybdopterin-binding protein [Thermoplasmata archaeon]